MTLPLASILLICAFVGASLAFTQQSVGAYGRIMCGNQPDAGTTVKLWNKNTISSFGIDDQLASTTTDSNGNFRLSGGVGSLLSMKLNAHLKIYTNCNRWLPCQRKIDMSIPSQYVTRTSTVQNWYNMGTLNVEGKFPGESSSCIN